MRFRLEHFEKAAEYKVRFIVHERPLGLIGAKRTGADAARGGIIVFFDCHVKPAPDYWVPFVENVEKNYRRVVVPIITTLDVDTWTETNRPTRGGMSKCYLTFDGEFKWTQDETEFVPLMSGGLLAMSQRWWRETGGYDREMAGWGGENIDQSLRIWRCGGEIVSATTSFVAHMWRDASEKRRAHYKIPANAKWTNVARAGQAHMGDWYGAKLLNFDPYVQFKADKLPGVGWGPPKLNTSEIRATLATCNRGYKAASGAAKIFNRTSPWVVSKRRSSHAL